MAKIDALTIEYRLTIRPRNCGVRVRIICTIARLLGVLVKWEDDNEFHVGAAGEITRNVGDIEFGFSDTRYYSK